MHSGAVKNTGSTPSVQYAYSEMPSGANHSRLTSVTYPDGYVLTYNYASGLNGDISRLSSLSDSGGTLESYDYLGLGTVVRRSHPQPDIDLTFLGTGPGSGGDQYVGLDSFGRVIDQHWKTTSATTDQFTYTYDRNSNRLTKGNSVDSDFDEVYTYDNLNQLTSFDRNTGDRTQAWDYDTLGNFDSVTTDGGSAVTRTHNKQNEITAVSGATSPTFDSNGNMTTDETGKQYVYDAWNRLKIVKNSGGTTLKTYVYDAMNRRVAETAGGATTEFYYSADWQVLEERDTARTNDTKARYVWSPVYVDAMVLRDWDTADDGTLDERLWVQQDANFNVTALVDDNGDVVERYAYDPYGVVTVLTPSFGSWSASSYDFEHGHQGTFFDSVAGLNYVRNRWYSPALMRWTTIDPIGYLPDNNLFRYVQNNPGTTVDPAGLFPPSGFWYPGRNDTMPVKREWPFEKDPENEPGQKIVIPGSEALVHIPLRKYEGPWPWSGEKFEYSTFRKGCIGLNSLRLNTGVQTALPNTQAYNSFEAALEAQKEAVKSAKTTQKVVIWAFQANASQKALDAFLKKGSKSEYELSDIKSNMMKIKEPGHGDTYDFATAFQYPDGKLKFWEVMPFGESINPNLDVIHKKKLYPHMGTVYFVVPIQDHVRAPLCPSGTAK